MTFEIHDNLGRSSTISYPDPDECECKQCGRTVAPSINPPAPHQGRYNGFADCPQCGAILWSISHDEFEAENE